MGRTILVTGGARSGKSRFAQDLAREHADANPLTSGVLYVATAEPLDDEMTRRIARHQAQRPAHWRTTEASRNLLGFMPVDPDVSVVLIDCLTVWIANRLLDLGDPEQEDWSDQVEELEEALMHEIARVIRRGRRNLWNLILVTNEVGWDVVPPNPLARVYRDLVGEINQAVSQSVDGVYLMVAGLPISLKGLKEELA